MKNFLISIVALAFTSFAFAPVQAWGIKVLADAASNETALEKQCDINVCFALDGSSKISSAEFKTEQDIIRAVVKSVTKQNDHIGLAAVQYGITTLPISSFTMNKRKLLSALQSSAQINHTETFLAAGLNFCFSELYEETEEKNKIVLLGSGQSTLGADPVERAKLFLESGGAIFSVGIGEYQDEKVLAQIAGGRRERLFSISDESSVKDVTTGLSALLCS